MKKIRNSGSYGKRNIRRSQIISIFGVGSIYLFKNQYSKAGDQDSLMLAGLDAWEDIFDNKEVPDEWKIFEPRLQTRLKKDFFLEPPDYREYAYDKKLQYKVLPYIRFPTWHYCYQCNCMKKISQYSSDPPKCDPKKDSNGKLIHEKHFKACSKNNETWKKKFLLPVRFMVICDHGHIDDFPFEEWVHRKNNYNPEKCELRFIDGRGGNNSLMNVRVDCVECNESYSLAEALNSSDENNPFGNLKNNNLKKCTGNRPWLGHNQNEKGCRSTPKVVLKQASNLYYPVVKSSIFIPVETGKIDRKILEFINKKEIWSGIIQFSNNKQSLEAFLTIPLKKFNLDKEKVLDAIESKLKGVDLQKDQTFDDEELFKYQEYQFIKNKNPEETEDLELKIKKYPIEEYGVLKEYFSNIFLIENLIETRVQTGFTRYLPYDPSKETHKQNLSVGHMNWYPGTIVKGEGIFFDFNEKKILDWSEQFQSEHLTKINDRYNKDRKRRGLAERKLNLKFFLIHTFSHLLINQLSYSCGYGSSSLRERVYCNFEHEDKNMNGVLLYTASGDSEGSLGGLVREGEPNNINRIIEQAITKSRVCSYDPICFENKNQGLNGTNASACHACSFLPETSCEESNQLLDRTCIIGDVRENLKGYFEDLIN